jgi:hypothetical protein
MAVPVSRIQQSYRDYSKEVSHLRLFVTTITPGNQAAQVALHTTLFAALDALTLGLQQKEETVLSTSVVNVTPATNPLAQRENKWLLRYHASVTRKNFVVELPCADLSLLGNNTDFIDKTGAEWLALKSAFEAVVVDPDDGGAVILDDAEFVGRNL